MTFLEGIVVASGLAIGYWLVSVFTTPADGDAGSSGGEGDDVKGTSTAPPWHDVLGVSEWASEEEVTAAYEEKIGQYPPDQLATMGQEVRELAERRVRQIDQAYQDAMRRS